MNLQNTDMPLVHTEGERKVDSLVSRGTCAIGIMGITAWKQQGVPLPDFDHVHYVNREVVIAFDSDGIHNIDVRRAQEELARYLTARGAV